LWLFQAYLAARCALDALAGEKFHYQKFDRMLMDWNLRKTSNTLLLNQRLQGAMRLLRQQATSFVLHLLLFSIQLV
jgi:hypothetical protein